MFKSITKLFQKSPGPVQEPASQAQARLLALQSQVQALKLELEEKEKSIQALNAAAERSRSQAAGAAQEKADTRLEALYTAIAAPVTQILTQADLIENQGKTLPAPDVLVLAKKMIKGLQENGLTLAGQIGERVVYNPDLHAPVSSDTPLIPGSAVRIRFVGVNYKSKLLKKALVDPASKE